MYIGDKDRFFQLGGLSAHPLSDRNLGACRLPLKGAEDELVCFFIDEVEPQPVYSFRLLPKQGSGIGEVGIPPLKLTVPSRNQLLQLLFYHESSSSLNSRLSITRFTLAERTANEVAKSVR